MAGETEWRATLDRVLELVALLDDDTTRSLGRIGLTAARAHVLWELQHRGPSTQRALADALHVSPRNVTGLVDALVEGGFVTREPHPADRRAALVSFTPHGAETAARLVADHRELARLLFAGMAPERFAGLAGGLDELLDRLRAALQEQP